MFWRPLSLKKDFSMHGYKSGYLDEQTAKTFAIVIQLLYRAFTIEQGVGESEVFLFVLFCVCFAFKKKTFCCVIFM